MLNKAILFLALKLLNKKRIKKYITKKFLKVVWPFLKKTAVHLIQAKKKNIK
jgi:hypothetical protein